MEFTDEEINLCKQVVERHEKPIEHGDWFIDMEIGSKPFLTLSREVPIDNLIPLWTISDCLEFFEKKEWGLPDMSWKCEVNKKVIHIRPKGKSKEIRFKAETLLGACLKAVLAVLEEEPNG